MVRTILLAAVIAACASSPSSGISASEVTCPPDSTLTYESFGASFISDNCLSCHDSKYRPTLTTHAAVQSNKSAIIDAAVTGTKMPANTAMTVEERQLL